MEEKEFLIKSRQEFKKYLQQQIIKGKELLNIKVSTNSSSFYIGYGISKLSHKHVQRVQYDAEEEKSFKCQYSKWDNYNKEIYRTFFNNPKNDYGKEYNSFNSILEGFNLIKEYKDIIQLKIAQMQSDIDRLDLIPVEEKDANKIENSSINFDNKKVFIVYGHDESLLDKVKLLLTQVGLAPIVLRDEPSHGNTIIKKIEENSDVGYGIVLYTPDDKVYAPDKKEDNGEDTSKPTFRARQNVIFEHGYLIGKLGRDHVNALVKGNLEIPGDLGGVVYTPIDKEGARTYQCQTDNV